MMGLLHGKCNCTVDAAGAADAADAVAFELGTADVVDNKSICFYFLEISLYGLDIIKERHIDQQRVPALILNSRNISRHKQYMGNRLQGHLLTALQAALHMATHAGHCSIKALAAIHAVTTEGATRSAATWYRT